MHILYIHKYLSKRSNKLVFLNYNLLYIHAYILCIGYFLGHNEDYFFFFFLPELFLTYAVNFFNERFIIKKASYLCTMCI